MKFLAIVNVIDQNHVLIDGPTSGVLRQEFPIKRMQLTPIAVKILESSILRGSECSFKEADEESRRSSSGAIMATLTTWLGSSLNFSILTLFSFESVRTGEVRRYSTNELVDVFDVVEVVVDVVVVIDVAVVVDMVVVVVAIIVVVDVVVVEVTRNFVRVEESLPSRFSGL